MKVGLLIASYNRPAYLRQCLASVKAADLSQVSCVMVIDDNSSDLETVDLIHNFSLPGVEITKSFKNENRSIKDSLLYGCDRLFAIGCDVVTNLDGDAIVRKDFIDVLLKLHDNFENYILTGFNCTTKNKDGSIRHKILFEGKDYNAKASVGGLNMMFGKYAYDKWVRPALVETLKNGGNWDHKSCLLSAVDKFHIICAVPSVCNHIGINSAMGHSKGGEPPDVADDFIPDDYGTHIVVRPRKDGMGPDYNNWKLSLPSVTLVGIDCVDVNRLLKAVDICCQQIVFGEIKLFSNTAVDKIVIGIQPLVNKIQYSEFMIKELARHIFTSHILVVQHDGYILNVEAWRDEWLQYDYIGAPWEWYTDGMNVGNGGFSLRSKKLMQVVADDPAIVPINEPGVTKNMEEDHCICRLYRRYLEETYDIKFAPIEEARKFSIEGWRSPNKTWTNEFGFHGKGLVNVKA